MTNLSIKNVPDGIVERLRERARRNHRSLQGELMALVTESVHQPGLADVAEPPNETGLITIEEIADEHRTRWPEPFVEGPSAADLIRAERDARYS